MHRSCRRRAKRHRDVGLPEGAYGLRGRLALDELTKNEQRTLELEQRLERARADAYEAGKLDGIKETLSRVARRAREIEVERAHDRSRTGPRACGKP
jgi:DNA-directed RNA polymerase delta subunit